MLNQLGGDRRREVMVVTVSHLVCRQVAHTPHNVRLASQQQSLRVFVHIVEQNLLLLAVRKTSLK